MAMPGKINSVSQSINIPANPSVSENKNNNNNNNSAKIIYDSTNSINNGTPSLSDDIPSQADEKNKTSGLKDCTINKQIKRNRLPAKIKMKLDAETRFPGDDAGQIYLSVSGQYGAPFAKLVFSLIGLYTQVKTIDLEMENKFPILSPNTQITNDDKLMMFALALSYIKFARDQNSLYELNKLNDIYKLRELSPYNIDSSGYASTYEIIKTDIKTILTFELKKRKWIEKMEYIFDNHNIANIFSVKKTPTYCHNILTRYSAIAGSRLDFLTNSFETYIRNNGGIHLHLARRFPAVFGHASL
jgi:hypothetical protein